MLGNIGDMMKQIKTMQENVEKVKEEMKNERIETEVGGGLVKIITNGLGEVIDIKIDKSILDEEGYELLKELLIAGINQAQKKSKEVMGEKLSEAVGLPNIPGLNINSLFS